MHKAPPLKEGTAFCLALELAQSYKRWYVDAGPISLQKNESGVKGWEH